MTTKVKRGSASIPTKGFFLEWSSSSAASRSFERLAFRLFEGGEDPPPDLDGVLKHLQSRGGVFPGVSEIEILRAGGDDKRVEPDLAFGKENLLGVEVEIDDLLHKDFDILVPFEDGPQRRGNIGGGQSAGRRLIQ